MTKIKFNKLIVRLAIILLIFIGFATNVNAIEQVSRVQNLKASYREDGTIDFTWDKINTDLNIDYVISYYKVGEELPSWGFSTENNYIDLSPVHFDIGYEYYVQVRADIEGGSLGEYSDAIKIVPILGKVSNGKIDTSNDSTISLSWDKVENATGYQVLYNNNYKTTLDTNIQLNNLKSATEYKIKVRAYTKVNDKTIYGNYSNELKTTTAPSKVTNIKTSVTSSGIKLTWNKTTGATGYRIYMATSKDGNYYELKTIDKNTNTFTDKDVYSGARFYYKIKAFKNYNNKRYMGPNSSSVTQVFVSAPKISINSYNDKATIKWDKVYNASGYKIYRAASKDGEYEEIKTIKKGKTTSYTDKKIKNKKVYYYKVRTYQTRSGKKYYSAYSSIKEKTKYAQVEITKATYNSSKKSNTLKWKKVSGVTGYKIYRATSKNGTYKHIKTISKNSTITYTDKKDIGVGKLYYYKIRAYKKSGSKTYYGQYSSSKKRTTGSRKQQMNKIKLNPGTCGSEEYDKEYKKIINKVTKGKKTVYDKVKACYKYVVDNMSHDKYHCKQFSGTFAGMMKVLGIQNVYCACGETTTTSGGWTGHTWVIMEINDTKYVFDPSIDKHIKDSTKKLSYSRFFETESEVSKKYKLEYYHSDAWPVNLTTGRFGVIYY